MPSPRVADLVALLQWQQQNTPALSWEAVGERWPITFPADYRELVSTFGSGVFDNIVGVTSPIESKAALTAFTRDMRAKLANARYNDSSPYRLFPDDGGLLPWGEAGDACTLFWRTDRGGPDDWTIVYCDASCSEWEEFDGSASEFLFELISGRIDSRLIEFEPIENPKFVTRRAVGD